MKDQAMSRETGKDKPQSFPKTKASSCGQQPNSSNSFSTHLVWNPSQRITCPCLPTKTSFKFFIPTTTNVIGHSLKKILVSWHGPGINATNKQKQKQPPHQSSPN